MIGMESILLANFKPLIYMQRVSIIKVMKFNLFDRKKFKCNLCDEKFKTGNELTEHNHIKHGPTK
jgi:hypothetical protein